MLQTLLKTSIVALKLRLTLKLMNTVSPTNKMRTSRKWNIVVDMKARHLMQKIRGLKEG